MTYYNPGFDLCDRCLEHGIRNYIVPGDHLTNERAGEPGYKRWTDLCRPCEDLTDVSTCAECGGMVDSGLLDAHHLCFECHKTPPPTKHDILSAGFVEGTYE